MGCVWSVAVAVLILWSLAVYCRYEKDVPFDRFYDGIMNYLSRHSECFTAKLWEEIRIHAFEQAQGITNRKLCFEPCGDIVWDDHEYAVLKILDNSDEFFADMEDYLRSFVTDDEIFRDLLSYQKAILRRPGEYERIAELNYDVHAFLSDIYVNKIGALKKRPHTLIMRDTDVRPDPVSFGKYVIWYGRMGWSSYKQQIIYKEK